MTVSHTNQDHAKRREVKMSTTMNKAQKVKVTTNIEGTPLTITISGKIKRIIRIYQQWQKSELICTQNVSKTYFRIKTTGGFIIDVYRDSTSNCWYLDKVYN